MNTDNNLTVENCAIIRAEDKAFISVFSCAMDELNYACEGLTPGFCWGKYMIIYSKRAVKDKRMVARIYIREGSIILRLFLNNIDAHREYIENAPEKIREPFVNGHGRCGHCHNEKDGRCKFRKSYTLFDEKIDKCNGITFEFCEPSLVKMPGYINLISEFYGRKTHKK